MRKRSMFVQSSRGQCFPVECVRLQSKDPVERWLQRAARNVSFETRRESEQTTLPHSPLPQSALVQPQVRVLQATAAASPSLPQCHSWSPMTTAHRRPWEPWRALLPLSAPIREEPHHLHTDSGVPLRVSVLLPLLRVLVVLRLRARLRRNSLHPLRSHLGQ